MEGNIVVDGMLASCYASVDHDLGHIAMAPLRWFPDIMEWIFGHDNVRPAFAVMAEELNQNVLSFSNEN